MDFSIYIFLLLVVGILSIYLLVSLIDKIDPGHKIILSLGLAPVLISGYNVINIALNFEHNFLMYIVPFLSTLLITFYYYNKRKTFKKNSFNILSIQPIFIGIIFGFAYWFILFYKYYMQAIIYPDIAYNLGIVSELKLNFPPVDPHWYTGKLLNYHFLTQLFIAGMSNFTHLNVISSMHCTNLLTSISTFVMLSLLVENKITERLIAFLLITFTCFSYNWIPSTAIFSHLTGASASTFFWSLPILVTILVVWEYVNKYRFEIRFQYLALIVLFSTVILFYVKGPFVFVFVILEFVAFVRFLFSSISKVKIKLKDLLRKTLYFILSPAFTIILIFVSRNASSTLTPGIEIRDFELFNSWNPIYPMIAIYGVIFVILILEIKNIGRFKIEYLFCSFFYFVMFLIYKHPGYSDLDFLFVAIILNSLLLITSKLDSILRSLLLSIFIITFIVFFFEVKNENKGFNTFSFNLDNFTEIPVVGDTLNSPRTNELLDFSKKLPYNSIIAVPKNSNERYFSYSAFIGRRIWNENNLYSFRTNSIYTTILLFQREEGFKPYYIKDTPKIEDKNNAYNEFISKGNYLDTARYEVAENRWLLYNKCVFDSLAEQDYLNIVNENKWTHILVENKSLTKVNYWIKNLTNIQGNYITIFKCP